MLRDIARQLSYGVPELSFFGAKVGVIDERGEICALYRGQMQNDVGIRTDVLDMCPKGIGIELMIRSMSPDVIITDEVANAVDVESVLLAHNTGVAIMASVHGESMEEIMRKSVLTPLFDEGVFDVAFILPKKAGVGEIKKYELAAEKQEYRV